jgi:uncharacterized protein (DUF305 family)
MRSLGHLLRLAAALALAGVACDRAGAQETRSHAELEALYRARLDSARSRYTPADVHFVTGMIHHHAQAIEMARHAGPNGASPSIRTLAGRIVNAQRDEIGLMQRWLADRGQPAPELMEMDDHVMAHGPGHDERMPGMLTPEQLARLGAARGPDFDRLFLTLMIEHHRGAVTMVEQLLAHDGAAQDQAVFKLASDVHVDQTTEIMRMQRMLDALP